MKRSGAQIVIESLCRNKVRTVFGYPGGAVLPIYDELYKNAHRLNHVLCAHEQNAVHAADGFARVTGRPGAVIATSGPGATLDNVVKTTCFLADINDFAQFNAVYARYFTSKPAAVVSLYRLCPKKLWLKWKLLPLLKNDVTPDNRQTEKLQ